MRYAVLVTGPAGAGKSTFCASLITQAQQLGRSVHLFNLDPAADKFEYPPSIDIRDLISLEEVMEDLELGPNGGLIYCFEYLMNNLDWLQEALGEYDDDFLIIDCPGQSSYPLSSCSQSCTHSRAVFRSNRIVHSHSRSPPTRQTPHRHDEHIPRLRLSPRVAVYGGFGKVLQRSFECDELYGRIGGSVRECHE